MGDLSVGKSSFIYRFIEDKFNSDQIPSTGFDLKTADLIIDNKNIRIQLWDSAGQEKYNSITKNLLLRVQGLIILFDLTNQETFDNLSKWIEIIKEHCGHTIPILFVGNKSDLEENRVVKKEDISRYVKKEKAKYIKTSCKTGDNIKKAVNIICKKIIYSSTLKRETSFSLEASSLVVDKKGKCC